VSHAHVSAEARIIDFQKIVIVYPLLRFDGEEQALLHTVCCSRHLLCLRFVVQRGRGHRPKVGRGSPFCGKMGCIALHRFAEHQ